LPILAEYAASDLQIQKFFSLDMTVKTENNVYVIRFPIMLAKLYYVFESWDIQGGPKKADTRFIFAITLANEYRF